MLRYVREIDAFLTEIRVIHVVRFCGVWVLCGAITGLLRHFVFSAFLPPGIALCAGILVAITIVAIMLREMGFSVTQAIIISVCGMVIALTSWPLLNIQTWVVIPDMIAWLLTLASITIAFPLFARGIKTTGS